MAAIRSQTELATRHEPTFDFRGAAPIVLVDGQKGGIGKSHLARVLAHILLKGGTSLVGIDGDAQGNPHLDRFYGKLIDVHQLDLREADDWGACADLIDGLDVTQVPLIDAPGGAAAGREKWSAQTGVSLNDLGRPIIRLWVQSNLVDGIIRLNTSRDAFELSRTIVVHNAKFGESEARIAWQKTNLRADLLEAGGQEVDLPSLHEPVSNAIHDLQCTFEDAAKLLPRFTQKKTVAMWLGQCEAIFMPAIQAAGGPAA